jgi:hypothetical protein
VVRKHVAVLSKLSLHAQIIHAGGFGDAFWCAPAGKIMKEDTQMITKTNLRMWKVVFVLVVGATEYRRRRVMRSKSILVRVMVT